jgi:hypothetical protein
MSEVWRLRVGVYGGWVAGLALLCVELAAWPHNGDFDLVLLLVSLWVAFLVLADGYLLVRRRRMIRPDYVAFVVAVCAVTGGLSDLARWASIACFCLAALAAAFAISLRLHQQVWWTRRSPVRSTAAAPPEAISPPEGGGVPS